VVDAAGPELERIEGEGPRGLRDLQLALALAAVLRRQSEALRAAGRADEAARAADRAGTLIQSVRAHAAPSLDSAPPVEDDSSRGGGP
jgi:hypothetical protein